MENSSDSPAWAENNRKKTQIIDSDNRTPFFHYISSPWIACFAVLLVCLGLYTRYNAFPPFYHVDEKRKVVYVQKGESNFYHPMLLMETSRCAARIFHAKNRDDIHVIGRDVSAWFAALSVIALLGVAFVHGGTVAAWTAGLFTALCSLLLTCAHYMKEDTALLFGLAFTCLALTLFLEKPQRRYQVLLAIACATVVSGKYVGAVVLFFALPLLFLPPRQDARDRWSSRLSWFLLPFLLTVMCINHAIIQHPAEFIEGLSYEASHVVTGHKGLAGVPFAQQDFDILIHQTPWPICLLAALYFVFFALTWRKRKVSEKVMALFPIGYFSILLLSEIQFSRYLLPVVVWLHFLAGMSLVELVRFLPWGGRSRAFIGIFLFAGILGLLGLRCGNFLDQFAHDSRERAARWATANLPRNAVVLEDNDVELKSFQTWGQVARPDSFFGHGYEMGRGHWDC